MKTQLFTLLCAAALCGCAEQAVKGPVVAAHRGYWKCEGGAQNSISSLVNAASIQAWGSEFDVWMTADDTLVVNHDPSFHGILLKEASYADIKELKLDNGEKISTVGQYLRKALEYPDLQLVFEIKTTGDLSDPAYEARVVPACIEAVRKYGLLGRTTFIAFSLSACEMVARLLPGHPVQYLNGDLPPKEVYEHGINGIDYWYPEFYKHPEWVSQAHELGMSVNCWTVNAREDILNMAELGVDQITTNEPTLAQKLLTSR